MTDNIQPPLTRPDMFLRKVFVPAALPAPAAKPLPSPVSKWDERWMSLARLILTWSEDRSRKFGAVIVDDREVLVSIGWNGFPRGVDGGIEERHQRPAKYQWTEHAERNAIFNAAAKGVSTRGCRIYVPWFPCADCARAIIQAGITHIACTVPDWDDATFGSDFKMVREMFEEVGMGVTWMEGESPEQKSGDALKNVSCIDCNA